MLSTSLILLMAVIGASTHAKADGLPANGSTRPSSSSSSPCPPIRTNTFTPLPDSREVNNNPTEKFLPWPLTAEQTRLGFMARRDSDNAFLVIPNKLNARILTWAHLTKRQGKNDVLCASRLVAVFQNDMEPSEVKALQDIAKSKHPGAKFVRPLMRNVQVEWTLPFIGLLHRFDPRPTFSLGGVVIVWDLDPRNTRLLERFIERAGPSVDLPGILMMQEEHTRLPFSIALSMSGETLLKNRYTISIEP